MVSKGHEVKVVIWDPKTYGLETFYDYEGVSVFPSDNNSTVLFNWAEVVITHLGWAAQTIYFGSVFRRPVIFMSQNYHYYDIIVKFPETPIIYNSDYMATRLSYPGRSIIVHPPVDYRKWDYGQEEPGEYITLINLNLNKGARLFAAICKAMPDRKFLAIRGSYDTQFIEELPNLTIWDNNPNMEPVYRATRILLMPSAFESWGMTAGEAMCNGIPVIYNETPGLWENVGNNGIKLINLNKDYEEKDLKGGEHPGIDPDANLDQWVKAIRKLDDPKTYKKFATLARKRSRELDPIPELEKLEAFLWATL